MTVKVGINGFGRIGRQVLKAIQEEYPKDKCVHELFEEQVDKTPGQTAIVFKKIV